MSPRMGMEGAAAAGGGGAPTDAAYVTTAANATLSAETLYSALNGRGLLADRPAPGTPGRRYTVTDDDGGTQFLDTGASWVAEAPGLTEAPAAHRTTHMPGGADAWTAYARKTADESVTLLTVLQDDDHLLVAVAANETWKLELVIYYEATTAGDLSIALSIPTGTAGTWGGHGIGNTATTNTDVMGVKHNAIPNSLSFGGAGAGIGLTAVFWALVRVGATGGSVRVQWAQRVSDVGATILKADSHMYGTRVV